MISQFSIILVDWWCDVILILNHLFCKMWRFKKFYLIEYPRNYLNHCRFASGLWESKGEEWMKEEFGSHQKKKKKISANLLVLSKLKRSTNFTNWVWKKKFMWEVGMVFEVNEHLHCALCYRGRRRNWIEYIYIFADKMGFCPFPQN